jgi:hypothetical protein
VIVLALRRRADDLLIVTVAPVTHSPPAADADAIETPRRVKDHLGLDQDRSGIVVDEVNEFAWPGFDLQPNANGEIAYGLIPSKLYENIRQRVLANARSGRLGRTAR